MSALKRFLILPFALFSIILCAQEALLDSIDIFFEKQAKKYHVPGIAACVVKGEKIVWSNAYGYSDIEKEVDMKTTSIMNIASISKTITATAVMQLWEDDKIDLGADVNQYLDFQVANPHFPTVPITVQHLLTHTSSIADGSALKLGFECGPPTRSLKDWISNYFPVEGEFYNVEENFAQVRPGSARDYSNVGFGLLGLIVEEISQQPFYEYVDANIFGPLKMDASAYFVSELDTASLVTSYLYLGPLQENISASDNKHMPYFNPYCRYSFWNYPDGLVRTSVEDLAKFAIAMMNDGRYDGNQILQKKTIDKMMTPQLSEAVNADQDQGLSWFQSSSLYPTWYHGGSDPGVSTRMYVNKEEDISVIVFQNVNVDNTYFMIRHLYDHFK